MKILKGAICNAKLRVLEALNHKSNARMDAERNTMSGKTQSTQFGVGFMNRATA